MALVPVTGDQTIRQHTSTAELSRYTEYSPTLKIQVEKRHVARAEEIVNEHIKKGTLKISPYRPKKEDNLLSSKREIDIKIDLKKNALLLKVIPPYISGYTGYIPGADRTYGLPFRKAVEAGALEWSDTQNRLQVRTDESRAYAEMIDIEDVLAHVRRDNVVFEVDLGHKRHNFDDQSTSESTSIDGCAGPVNDANGGVALSKRYAQAVDDGLELLLMDRETKFDMAKNAAGQGILDQEYINATGHMRTPRQVTNQVTPENSPIDDYTGHMPRTKRDIYLSKRHAQELEDDLDLLRMDRETKFDLAKNAAGQEVLDQEYIDATGHMRAPRQVTDQVTSENSPIDNYAAYMPRTKRDIYLSKRHEQELEDDLDLLRMDREMKFDLAKNAAGQGVLDQEYIDATRHMRTAGQVTSENSPFGNCAGHMTKGEVALSKKHAQEVDDDLELMRMDRETRFDMAKNADFSQGYLDQGYIDVTRHMREPHQDTD